MKNKPAKGRYLKLRQQTRLSLRMRMSIVAVSSTLFIGLLMLPVFLGDIITSESAKAFSNATGKREQVEMLNDSSKLKDADQNNLSLGKNSGSTGSSLARSGYPDLTAEGSMYLTNGVIVSNEGSFIIGAAGTISNDGDMYVKGDLTNNGTYTTATGKVTFWGSDAALINGTNSSTIHTAVINNTGGVTLGINTTVSNNLDLVAGRLDLNSRTLTISNAATSGISYTAGYILSEDTDNSSKVQWNISNTTGSHIIPFGTASGTLIPLTLNLTAGNIGNVTTSTFPVATNNLPLPSTPTVVTNVNDWRGNDNSANVVDRFWQIDRSGADGTLSITFTYTDAEVPANGESILLAQRYNNSSNRWDAPVGSQTANTATNTVTAPGITTYGPYTLALHTGTLPVELVSFTAKLNSSKEVDLYWVTASEKDNDFFTIERSQDGKTFSDLAYIKTQGNLTTLQKYHHTDKNPLPGTSYYRLRQTDIDGTNEAFNIVSVNIDESKNDKLNVRVWPNPYSVGFTAEFNSEKEIDATANIFDAKGVLVHQESLRIEEGINTYRFENSGNMVKGMFTFSIISKEGVIANVKLIKE
jgi:hypothetical protein